MSESDKPQESGSDLRRVLVLLGILGLVVLVTVLVKFYERSERQANIKAARSLIKAAKLYIEDAKYQEASAAASEAIERYGEDLDVARAYVGVMLRLGVVEDAVSRFNRLVDTQPEAMRLSPDPRLVKILEERKANPQTLRTGRLGPADRKFLSDTCYLYGLAQRITRGAKGETERAMAILEWMNRSVLPLEETRLDALPRDVVFRAWGGPKALTWTFASLLRQVGLRPWVVRVGPEETPEAGLLVAVAADGRLLLFDPLAGIPIVDAEGKRILSLEEVAGSPEVLSAVRIGGEPYRFHTAALGAPDVVTVAHPYMLLPRMQLLGRVAAEIPSSPVVSLDMSALTEPLAGRLMPSAAARGDLPWTGGETGARLAVWDAPFETLQLYELPAYRNDRARHYGALSRYQMGRDLTLAGQASNAVLYYGMFLRGLDREVRQRPGSWPAELRAQVVEDTAFFNAQALSEAGAYKEALPALEGYLERYPEGMWRVLARTEAAVCTQALKGREEAGPVWRELSGLRKAYGELRASGAWDRLAGKGGAE
jgi:tetratricopeptide (TPR) repeat protein